MNLSNKQKNLILLRSKWKPFGKALIDNTGITSSNEEIFFEIPPKPFFHYYRYFVKHNSFPEEYFKSIEHTYIKKLNNLISLSKNNDNSFDKSNEENSIDNNSNYQPETNIMGDKINKNRFVPSIEKDDIITQNTETEANKPINYILKISNLPYDISSETIEELLSEYSVVNKIIIPTHYNSDDIKGYSFVYIKDQSMIDSIIQDFQDYRMNHNILLFEKIIDKYNKSLKKNKNQYSSSTSTSTSTSPSNAFADLKQFSQQFSKN
jgi:hypothetical protein